MELWRELLISGLQNESIKFDLLNDGTLIELLEVRCYKILLQIKQTVDNVKLSDEDCFTKIEKILSILEENNIYFDRHDFG